MEKKMTARKRVFADGVTGAHAIDRRKSRKVPDPSINAARIISGQIPRLPDCKVATTTPEVSDKATPFSDSKSPAPIRDVATRWKPTLHMLNRLILFEQYERTKIVSSYKRLHSVPWHLEWIYPPFYSYIVTPQLTDPEAIELKHQASNASPPIHIAKA
ncbi:hypothetical protein BT96DRAFT_938876 [Gymnopus androsaceus JB14]|uniref:Uncharacterized protein n=1 Tax=Gymnopus androsaceus JB14 TaxID=1447944 RepID=A0A6A4HQ45_9AGAR|nr:hypothetical protein BT96DRAFT_938876 [Gymnopus androsaceus JB14]